MWCALALTVPGFLALLAAVQGKSKKVVVREAEVVKADRRGGLREWWDQILWWWNHPFEGSVCIKDRKAALRGTQNMLAASKDSQASVAATADSQASAAGVDSQSSATTSEESPAKWVRFRGESEAQGAASTC